MSLPIQKENNHESFDPTLKFPKSRVIRQDRKDVEMADCSLVFNNHKYKIKNISSFGVAVIIESPENFTEDFDATIYVNECDVGQHRFSYTRTENVENQTLIALEVIGAPISTQRVDGVLESSHLTTGFLQNYEKFKNVPPFFKSSVLEIKDRLEIIQLKLNEVEAKFGLYDSRENMEYYDTIIQLIGEHIAKFMPMDNSDLREIFEHKDENVTKSSIEYFREKIGPMVYQSPFADRTFRKPLGYAGDYEMMNMLYHGERFGNSLFAKCISYYLLTQPAGMAVKNRATYLIRKIKNTIQKNSNTKKKIRILSLASGPAMEWQKLLAENINLYGASLIVDLIDQDELSLKHAQLKITTLMKKFPVDIKFNFINRSIKNIVNSGLEENDYDLIYSAGLFDYFSDPVAQMASTRLFEKLSTHGEVIIGNFDVSNPNRFFLELAFDWYLIYRTEDSLKNLFKHLGPVEIEKEDLGINLFCVIKRS
jgi:hypothetical protein